MKKIAVFIELLVASLLLLVGAVPHVLAAPSGLYLSPSNGSFAKDSVFNIQVRLGNSSASGVQANVYFDTSKLAVTGTSNQGSSFNPTVSYDNGNGRIIIYSASANGSGDRLVTTVSFKAIATGTANVTFSGTNQTLAYLLLVAVWSDVATSNASYTITAPASPTPPATGSGNTPAPGSTSSAAPAPASPTAPSITPSSPQLAPDSSASNIANSEATTTPDAAAPYTPSPKQSEPNFQATQPDADAWDDAPAQSQVNNSSFSWLPAILAFTLGLIAIAVFAVYRRTHMTHSLQRLLSGVISYKVSLAEQSVTPATAPLSFIAPVVSLFPKLLAYKAPKLLASGIKQKLLSAGTRMAPPRH